MLINQLLNSGIDTIKAELDIPTASGLARGKAGSADVAIRPNNIEQPNQPANSNNIRGIEPTSA